MILKKLDTINSYSSDKDKPYIATYKSNITKLLHEEKETNYSINNILTKIVKNNIEYGVLIEELFLFNIDTHDSKKKIIDNKKQFVNIIFELLKNNNNENNIYDETNNSQQYYHYRQEKPLNLNNETTKKEIY